MNLNNAFWIGIAGACIGLGCWTCVPSIERNERIDGYGIVQGGFFGEYVSFSHNSFENEDYLYAKGVSYWDEGCDGLVDKLHSLSYLKRGDIGTEEIFNKADETLRIYKEKLGVSRENVPLNEDNSYLNPGVF